MTPSCVHRTVWVQVRVPLLPGRQVGLRDTKHLARGAITEGLSWGLDLAPLLLEGWGGQ